MVKLKVMSKDTNGKPVYKYITLRAQQPSKKSSNSTAQQEDNLSNSLGLRDVPKVCYTGRRGRPKTIKPGQFDPHEKERRQIEARLEKHTVMIQIPDSEYIPDHVPKREFFNSDF
jgi:hypothetical protein